MATEMHEIWRTEGVVAVSKSSDGITYAVTGKEGVIDAALAEIVVRGILSQEGELPRDVNVEEKDSLPFWTTFMVYIVK